MRSLLLKSALLVFILLLIKLPFARFYQTEPDFRLSEFATGEFNTVFIGSSRTRHAVIPGEFDRQTNQITQSYNFGISGGLPPLTFDWCEDLIETEKSLKYVFFELSGGMDTVLEDDVSLSGFSLLKYRKALATLSFDESSVYHNKLLLALFKPDLSGNYTSYNGSNAPAFEKEQRELRKKASHDTLRLSQMLNRQMETQDVPSPAAADQDYLLRIRRLIEIAESKQIQIYFYIPPRIESEEEFRIVYPIYRQLGPKYMLDISHEDGSLYEPDTSYDNFHLNYDGAMLFTEHFAKAFHNRDR